MPIWYVECSGDVREVYAVEADTESESLEKWSDGELVVSEASTFPGSAKLME